MKRCAKGDLHAVNHKSHNRTWCEKHSLVLLELVVGDVPGRVTVSAQPKALSVYYIE